MSLRSLLAPAGATALAALVLVGAATAGHAADRAGSIDHVEVSDGGLQVLVSVPADAKVRLGGVQVTVDGATASAKAAPAGDSTTVRRTAVLAVDTSNSMRGARFEAAQQAALAFLDAVPDDVELGIVSYAGAVDVSLPPTTDRAAARAVVEDLELSRGTRLYDGVLAAVEQAGTEGQRSLLVLSDGADTSSTDLDDVTTAVGDAGVLVDVVALEEGDSDLGALESLAQAGSGEVIPAGRAALRKTFSAEADVLARQVLVTAQVPEAVTRGEATVAVTLPAGPDTVTAEAYTTVREVGAATTAPAVTSVDGGWRVPDWTMYVGVLALGAGLVGLLVLLVPHPTGPMSPAERVASYTSRGRRDSPSAPHMRLDTDQALAQARGAAAGMLKRNRGLEERIALRLEGAGSELKPAEWVLVHVGVFLLSGLVGILLGSGSLLVGLLFLVLGALGPWLVLGFRRSRRRKAFAAQLPETLQLMSGSLAAGLSLAQSVDTIVREGAEPVSAEFRRVLAETRLGVPLEDAFEGVAERFESKDFAWVVMAIKIQRQVGGNLAELLDTVAATMREREYVRRQVSALAAEGKLSAWVLGALPPLFLLYLVLTNGEYVEPLFTDPRGWIMLIGGGLWLGVGVFWMSRLIKVEV